jgi:hypothetical protein
VRKEFAYANYHIPGPGLAATFEGMELFKVGYTYKSDSAIK